MKNGVPDYLKLFIRREGKIVLGRNFSNVWLLTAMLVASFFSIAFANGSLNYLGFKMDDPFIKWVDIKENRYTSGSLKGLEYDLSDARNQERYHYSSHSDDYEYSYHFFGCEDGMHSYLRCRFIDAGNKELVKAIAADKNRVAGIGAVEVDDLPDNCLGLFVTAKAMRKLGYVDEKGALVIPAYLDYYRPSHGAAGLGFRTSEGRVRVPVPVLGVVRRLPGSVDILAFTNLYRQITSDAFYMNNEAYASSLCYFIPEDVDEEEFDEALSGLIREHAGVDFRIDRQTFCPRELYSWKNRLLGTDKGGYHDYYIGFRKVVPADSIPPLVANKINYLLLDEYAGRDVHRLYEYDYSYDRLGKGEGNYISVYFDDLKNISSFAEEVVEKNELEIEMSQINAKENFQALSVMAVILSVVMVIFTIVCILLFIVNLLRSYFQKVKRNIGTFKAFGISNRELQKVYMIIMLALVCSATLVSLAVVSLVQLLLPAVGLVREDGFGFLSLWRCDILAFPPAITLSAVALIVVAAAVSVHVVLKKLLSATPGDLIYDR